MLYKFIFMLLLTCACTTLRAQDTTSNANLVAIKIAKKMQDSLSLSAEQKNAIRAINLKLHENKMAARSAYSNIDSVTRKVQRIENTRDSLYQSVLSVPQYEMYLQKKRNLISAN
jgi:hypothetical protein